MDIITNTQTVEVLGNGDKVVGEALQNFQVEVLMDIISIQTVSIQRKLWNTWNT